MAVILLSGLLIAGFDDQRPKMSDLAWAKELDRPRALAVSTDLATSFPLARKIGAIWVDRSHSQWVARYTSFALQFGRLTESQRRLYLHYYQQDLEWILRRIEEVVPDLIIEDVRPEMSWITRRLAAIKPNFLDEYETVAEEGGIRVRKHRTGTAKPN